MNGMLTKEIAQEQLNHIYHAINRAYDNRQTTKRWALVVWTAIVAGMLSGKIILGFYEGLLVVNSAIIVFWIYEGISGAYGIFAHRQAVKLERLLTSENLETADASEYMHIQAYERLDLKEKIRAYLYALFKMETVFIFYMFLSVLSLVILWATA